MMKLSLLFLISAKLIPIRCSASASDSDSLMGDSVTSESIQTNPFFDACLNVKTNKLEKYFESGSIPAKFDDPIDGSNTSPLQILIEKASLYAEKDEKRTKQIAGIIDKLVLHGANLERVTDSGWTPLSMAVFWASEDPFYPLEIIKSLLPAGRNCPAINLATRSRTPLHFAAGSRLPNGRALELVNLLVERCSEVIDYMARDSKGWSPLKVAINADNFDVKDILSHETPSFTLYEKVGIMSVTVALIILMLIVYFNIRKSKKKEKTEPAYLSSDSDNDSINDSVNDSVNSDSDILLTERNIQPVEDDE